MQKVLAIVVDSPSYITGIHHGTILKLLVFAGDVEMDEVWAFIGKKEKRVRPEDDQNLGDAYTFIAIERNTKLVLNIAMGKRDKVTAMAAGIVDRVGMCGDLLMA